MYNSEDSRHAVAATREPGAGGQNSVQLTTDSSIASPRHRRMNLVPTRCPCSSECVIHTMALSTVAGERNADTMYRSTSEDDSGSSAEVGSTTTISTFELGKDPR